MSKKAVGETETKNGRLKITWSPWIVEQNVYMAPKILGAERNHRFGHPFFCLVQLMRCFFNLGHTTMSTKLFRKKKDTPPKTNMSPYRGTISIGNTSSNHWFLGDMLVFQGVLDHLPYSLHSKDSHSRPMEKHNSSWDSHHSWKGPTTGKVFGFVVISKPESMVIFQVVSWTTHLKRNHILELSQIGLK